MCACSVHSACLRAVCSMRACSVLNACEQCAQCMRAVCIMSACGVHYARFMRAVCTMRAAWCFLLAACCWLLAAGCLLLAAAGCCWLLAAGWCWLLAAGCWWLLAGVGCWLLVAAGCWLLAAAGCWLLLAAGCWLLLAACWLLLAAGCCCTFCSGMFAYIMLGIRLKDAWLADTQCEGPRQCVKDASFVHGFILFCRRRIATSIRGETMAIVFITRETFLDVVTSASTAIYGYISFRDHYPNYAPVGNRFASRFDEYFFQFSPMRQKNAPSFGVKRFLTHVRHYTCEQFLVAEGQWETPSSKCGAPHRIWPHSNSIPLNFTDAD